MTRPAGRVAGASRGRSIDALALAALSLLAWLGPTLALRVARPALLNFGPNDVEYVQGFRSDWERDRLTRFHWTTPSARVTLPLLVRGENLMLRMRVRRHFVEPAHVRLIVEGKTAAVFDLAADPRVPYRVLEIPLPRLEGRHPFVLAIEAPSENPRPLGIAMDWMEIARTGSGAYFTLFSRFSWAVLCATLLAFVASRWAGASRAVAGPFALGLVGAASLGAYWDVLAAERIVREGLVVVVGVALVALVLVRWPLSRALLGIPASNVAGALVILVLAALVVRLALLLHPQFYYPDVKVHGLFVWQLAREGLAAFLRDFTANQYRFSLGLQMVNGHWYAFPYPPVFYVLCWPLVALVHMRPEVAVAVLAGAVNSLEVLLVFAIARRLGAATPAALLAAAAVPVLPLFLARLTLAYFPAVVGHAVDAVVLCYLLTHVAELDRRRVVLTLAGLVALALLTYTQSVLNLGILLPLFLAFQIAADRTPAAWRRHAGLAVAGVIGVALAIGVFYGRYAPILLDMKRGVPMPEERILVEKFEQSRAATEETAPEPLDDPFAGPDLDLVRGLKKAAWRLFIFYGGFAPFVVAGLALVLRATHGPVRRFAAAWALTYVLLNLASGGLPGPNLVRYNKDLEIVAPLFCTALAACAAWLWQRGRVGSIVACVYAGSFVGFGAIRAARYLAERFVLER